MRKNKSTLVRKRYFRRIYLCILMSGMIVTAGIQFFTAVYETRQKKENAYHMLELYGVRTESLLTQLFHKTDILESIIISTNGLLDQPTFDNLAQPLMEGSGIRAIQCLPDGVVTFCYPLEGNEGALGDNIFEIPERREDALLALETKQIALSGPYTLTQGGFGLAARNPVFLTDENGTERFWGFTVVILDLPEALAPLMTEELAENGYAYQLSCEVNGETVVIDQSKNITENGQLAHKLSAAADMEYIQVDIHVPNHAWNMKLLPKNGWLNVSLLLFEGIIGLSFTLLCTVIVYLLEKQRTQMEISATTDELTGLLNRRSLNERLAFLCQDGRKSFSMFYIDLNRFKSINDSLGHTCGDAVLQETGRRLVRAMGTEGSIYRIGGDEFICLTKNCVQPKDCLFLTETVRKELSQPFAYRNHPVTISASIGWAIFPDEGADPEALLRTADEKMYREKKS